MRPGATTGRCITLALVVLCPLLQPARVTAQAEANERVSEAIRLERTIKRRYLELIRIMHDVSQQLAKADPETAAAVEAAAQKAEEALIADDMDRVVQLLQGGLVLPADATQAKIIERLQVVLKALQGGDELEWTLFMTEMIREQVERLALLIGRQRELERHSRAVFRGGDMLGEIDAIGPKIVPLQQLQEKLLAAVRDMPQSLISVNFGMVRGRIADVSTRLADARGMLTKGYPSPDEMVNNAATTRLIHRNAVEMRTGVRTVLNQTDVDAFMDEQKVGSFAPQLMEHLDNVVSELEIAARAFTADDLDAAILAVAECEQRIRDAGSTFEKIADADPESQTLRRVLSEQERLAKEFGEIRAVVESTIPQDLSSGLASGRMVDYDLGKASIDTGDQYPVDAFGAAASAAILQTIRSHDMPAAMHQQEQMLSVLGDLAGRVDAAAAAIKEWHTSPRFPLQQRDQQGIVKDVRHVIERYASLTEAAGDKSVPLALTGELRASIDAAADLASRAAVLLGEEKAEPANVAQNEVIRLLSKVVDDMKNINTSDISGFIKELLDQWIGLIQRMLLKQKICIEETVNVWKKRQPGEKEPAAAYSRAQQLQMRKIVRTQQGMFRDIEKMRLVLDISAEMGHGLGSPSKVGKFGERPQSLTERAKFGGGTGMLAASGMFIALIEVELDHVVRLLDALDPGLDTQRRQDLIKSNLETILAGVKGEEDDDPSKSNPMASNDFCNPQAGARYQKRAAVIRMVIALQEQINLRTKQLEQLKRAGKWSDDLEKETTRLGEMQQMVHGTILEFALQDATWWRTSGGLGGL